MNPTPAVDGGDGTATVIGNFARHQKAKPFLDAACERAVKAGYRRMEWIEQTPIFSMEYSRRASACRFNQATQSRTALRVPRSWPKSRASRARVASSAR